MGQVQVQFSINFHIQVQIQVHALVHIQVQLQVTFQFQHQSKSGIGGASAPVQDGPDSSPCEDSGSSFSTGAGSVSVSGLGPRKGPGDTVVLLHV